MCVVLTYLDSHTVLVKNVTRVHDNHSGMVRVYVNGICDTKCNVRHISVFPSVQAYNNRLNEGVLK